MLEQVAPKLWLCAVCSKTHRQQEPAEPRPATAA